MFDELPAPVWGDRARVELAATGETGTGRRLAGRYGLTSQELQVAHLLAQEGATVREAAAKLFLSPKTVEVHLSRVYRKLAVSDRAGLRSAIRRSATWSSKRGPATLAGAGRRIGQLGELPDAAHDQPEGRQLEGELARDHVVRAARALR